jgi:hypothetical protein
MYPVVMVAMAFGGALDVYAMPEGFNAVGIVSLRRHEIDCAAKRSDAFNDARRTMLMSVGGDVKDPSLQA